MPVAEDFGVLLRQPWTVFTVAVSPAYLKLRALLLRQQVVYRVVVSDGVIGVNTLYQESEAVADA